MLLPRGRSILRPIDVGLRPVDHQPPPLLPPEEPLPAEDPEVEPAGVPEAPSANQVPPKLWIFSPAAVPGPESPEYMYTGQPW